MAKQGMSCGEIFMTLGGILGALLAFAAALPVVPWRYAPVDTNLGDRFVQARRYTLMGTTDQFGKPEGWFALAKKMQRKNDEFGTPSPLTALVGTVSDDTKIRGAAVGCALWPICKEHLSQRSTWYERIAWSGLISLIWLVVGGFAIGVVPIMLGHEHGGKKKIYFGLHPRTRTFIASVMGFLLVAGATAGFVYELGLALETFQETAYYPFAALHVGPYIAGAASVVNFMVMWIAMIRLCGTSSGDDDEHPRQTQKTPAAPTYGVKGPFKGPPPPGAKGPFKGGPPTGGKGKGGPPPPAGKGAKTSPAPKARVAP